MFFIKKSSDFFTNLKTIVIAFSLSAVFVISGQAQNINNDLQPKKPTSQKTNRTSKPAKVTKTAVATPRKQNAKKSAVKTSSTPETTAQAEVQTPVAPETPPQIIERFINFQQSSGVADKDWESIISQTTQTLQNNPNDNNAKAQMLVAQGELAFNRKDYSNALIQFNAASQVLPNFALPFYGIGRVYLATKQAEQAENAFEKAIKLNKNFALAHKGIGDALTAQGKVKKAQEHFKEAAQIGLANGTIITAVSPNVSAENSANTANNQTAQSEKSSAIYETELKAARVLTGGKKWQDSLDKLQSLTQDFPTTELFIAIGDNYFGLEQWLSAQQSYQKASETNPNSALAFYKKGMVLFEMNEFQTASEAFEKSLILDQKGTFINRRTARKMADKANEKAREAKNGKKKIFGLI